MYGDIYTPMNTGSHGGNKPKPVFSRLDHVFVNEHFVQFIQKIEVIPGFRLNHSFVKMVVCLEYVENGPTYWKFNTSLLRDSDYIEKINNLLDIELEQDFDLYKNKWELIKLAVRGTTVQYASRKQKSNCNKIEVLQRKLQTVEQVLHGQSEPVLRDYELQGRHSSLWHTASIGSY